MKLLRRIFLGASLIGITLLLTLFILMSAQTAQVQETPSDSGLTLTQNGHRLSITGPSVPADKDSEGFTSGPIQGAVVLVNDGSFENSPSAWIQQTSTNCTNWIANWASTTGFPAYHGLKYFWAGGTCALDGQTPVPNSNSAEQRGVNVPAAQTTLSFWYRASRLGQDDPNSEDFAYVEVNGNRVWDLAMTRANNTNGWVNATVDLSTYANQIVLLKFGAANDQSGGVGNVFFDFVEFRDPLPLVSFIDPETGGMLTYTSPDGLPTIITVPSGAVTDTIALVYTPRGDPGHPLGNLLFAGQAFDLDAHEHLLYLPSILRAPAADDRPAAISRSNATATGAHVTAPAATSSYTFLKPVEILVTYSDDRVPGAEANLYLYYWTGSEWKDAVNTCPNPSGYIRDPVLNTISLSVCHLTRFSVVGAG
ncbi:MAG TPA: hypothetical protein VF177_07210 [Anaerolineae bacterium]